jgi:membrane protein implicated in regulation of membrane protease activity
MNRDTLYLIIGGVVFAVAVIVLYLATDWSPLRILIAATLLSIASDILIVFDNERRNAAPDAKFHHRNELVGKIATAIEAFQPGAAISAGIIEIHGERWRARANEPGLKSGDRVRIIDRDGMTLIVEKWRSANPAIPHHG